MMTVKDLIEQLSQYEDGCEVLVDDGFDSWYGELTEVELIKDSNSPSHIVLLVI